LLRDPGLPGDPKGQHHDHDHDQGGHGDHGDPKRETDLPLGRRRRHRRHAATLWSSRLPRQAGPARLYRAPNARNSSAAASMPFGRYSSSSFSFGEWMFESGSGTPGGTVGMPFPASAGTIGSVPPERISSGRTPRARSNASRASWIGFDDWSTRPGALGAQWATTRSAPSGVASRSSRSTSAAIVPGFWPGARRIETLATASTGSTVF